MSSDLGCLCWWARRMAIGLGVLAGIAISPSASASDLRLRDGETDVGIYVPLTIGDAPDKILDKTTQDLRVAVWEVLGYGQFRVDTTDSVLPDDVLAALDTCSGDDCLRLEAEAHKDQYILTSQLKVSAGEASVILMYLQASDDMRVVKQQRGQFAAELPSHNQLTGMLEELFRDELTLCGQLRIEGNKGKVILDGTNMGPPPYEADVAIGSHTIGKGRRLTKVELNPGEVLRFHLESGRVGAKNLDLPKGMVLIPGAQVRIGCKNSQDGCVDNPERKVRVPAFLLDRSEVTVHDYEKCVKAGACPQAKARHNKMIKDFCNGGRHDRTSHPMNCVTWSQAQTFCRQRERRLPTRDEWERAARGVDSDPYPWGTDSPSCRYAVYRPSGPASLGCSRKSTSPVMSRAAGATKEGVFDLSGNVAEWVQSKDGRWVAKGGAWVLGAAQLQAWSETSQSSRYKFEKPTQAMVFGFRCAKDID